MPRPKISTKSPDAPRQPIPGPSAPAAPPVVYPGKDQRDPKGRYLPGVSGGGAIEAGRARKALNNDTIRMFHRVFAEEGEAACYKVIRTQPALFLKLLVLLVPRELEITNTNSVKQMSDEAIQQAIDAIQDLLAKRDAGENAKVVEASETEKAEKPEEDQGDTGLAQARITETMEIIEEMDLPQRSKK